MTLDIPAVYKELDPLGASKLDSNCDITIIHPQVTMLSLRVTPRGKFQSLLVHCTLIFPNLQYLDLYYSSGIWNDSIGEFQVKLPDFSLESLAIDKTPAKRKMEEFAKCDFSVIEVESLSTFGRQIYKVHTGPTLLTVTRIKSDDLRGYTLGVDFTRINIVVKELQFLEVFC